MFCFPGLRRMLAVVGLAGALACGLATESSAQGYYGGEYYASPYARTYDYPFPQYAHEFVRLAPARARHHHHFAFDRFGVGPSEREWFRYARLFYPRVYRFASEPRRSMTVSRFDLRRFRIARAAKPQRLILPRQVRVQPVRRSNERVVTAQATQLRRIPNQRSSRGLSEPKPQRLLVPRFAAVPLPPRHPPAKPTPTHEAPAVDAQTKLSSRIPVVAAAPSSKVAVNSLNVPKPAHSTPAAAKDKSEGAANNERSETVAVAPPASADSNAAGSRQSQEATHAAAAVSRESTPPGDKAADAAAPADPSDRKVAAAAPGEPKPDLSHRSSAEDDLGADPGDGADIPVAPTGGAKSRPNMAFAVNSPGTLVSVKFLPTATTHDILAFLVSYNLMIADGPSPEGRYRVRLSYVQLPKELVDQFVKSMRAQTKIVKDVKE